jgi:hypothetical protein
MATRKEGKNMREEQQEDEDLAPAGARSGEYGGWTSFCFPA